MKKQNKSYVQTDELVIFAILSAILARILGKLGYASITTGLARTMIYIGLYTAWGISIRKRVIQTQVRIYLSFVVILMVFWFVIRTIKYYFVFNPIFIRYLWYLYYVPMLFIPVLAVYISLSLGQTEGFKLSKWALLFYVPTLLCLILVLSNDLHQWVFTFPSDVIWSDKNNGYASGYYIVFVWNVICALTAIILMLIKCKSLSKKKYLPIIALAISIAYGLVYASGAEWMQIIAGDVTAAQCLMFAGVFESCIRCGLIRVNTGYDVLFEAGSLGIQITDNAYSVCHRSIKSKQFSRELMREAEYRAVSLDKNTLLKSFKISGGHVLWQENITEISKLLEQLDKNKEKIIRGNKIEKKNYDIKLKLNSAQSKNRLYKLLQKYTVHQIDLICNLLDQYNLEHNQVKRNNILAKIAVIGSYVKRRGNLMFIMEGSNIIEIVELSRAIDESISNISLLGVECAVNCPSNGSIYAEDVTRIYDFFELVIENAIDSLQVVWVYVRSDPNSFIVNMEFICDKSLLTFANFADNCVFEDGVWHFTLTIVKVGNMK